MKPTSKSAGSCGGGGVTLSLSGFFVFRSQTAFISSLSIVTDNGL